MRLHAWLGVAALFAALFAVAACGGGGGLVDLGLGHDAGHDPVTPVEPPPRAPVDSGVPITGGGGGGAGGASPDAGSEPAPLPPNFTLECADETETGTAGDPLAEWQAEREAHGAVGHAATFALEGTEYRLHGTAHARVEAPFTLHVGNIGLLGFAEASVADVDERGELELYATDHAQLTASAGAIEELALETIVVEGGMLDAAIDVVTERLGNTDFHRASASVVDLALDGVQQAYLSPEGSVGLDQRIEWMPSGPVVVTEASQLTFFVEDAGTVEKAMSEPLALQYEAFGLAGDFSAGALEVQDAPVRGTPMAVFGREAELRAGASTVEASERFRLTQAVNEAGLVLPATVEIVAETPEVWVAPNKTRVVRLHFRERSYLGDAVLGEIEVGGEGEALLELQTGFPKTLTGEIVNAVLDTGWAAPLLALAALPTVSVVFVIDVFSCIFGGCLNQPAPLDPFPQWIEAGEIGTMEVRVKGDLGIGTYETSLTFVGRNYCPVTVPLTVHVGQQPVAVDAGSGAGDGAVADGG